MLHHSGTIRNGLESLLLRHQSILKSNCVLIEDARSFQAEVINDGGCFGA
jgi:hypothetical protein